MKLPLPQLAYTVFAKLFVSNGVRATLAAVHNRNISKIAVSPYNYFNESCDVRYEVGVWGPLDASGKATWFYHVPRDDSSSSVSDSYGNIPDIAALAANHAVEALGWASNTKMLRALGLSPKALTTDASIVQMKREVPAICGTLAQSATA